MNVALSSWEAQGLDRALQGSWFASFRTGMTLKCLSDGLTARRLVAYAK